MYKLHYDVYLATMKESGTFVTKHAVINYVNQLAAAQQLACLNTAGAGAAGDDTAGSLQRPRSFPSRQGRPIERIGNAESRTGFRSARPARGGRMVPSLTVQIPSSSTESADAGAGVFASQQVKGAKTTGSVKVQNQFAGLDVE
jgi:hypothetical protein